MRCGWFYGLISCWRLPFLGRTVDSSLRARDMRTKLLGALGSYLGLSWLLVVFLDVIRGTRAGMTRFRTE